MKTKRLFGALLCMAALTMGASAKTIYVSYSGSNANNGLTWANAVLSIDTAKVRAAAGDDIWVQGDAEGLTGYNNYEKSSTEAGQGKEALMLADVNIYGGFKGNETAVSQRQLADNDANGIVEPWEFKYPTRIVFTLSNGARAFVCGGQTSARVVDGLEFWIPNNYDFSAIAAEVQLFVIGPNAVFRNNTIRDGFLKTNNASLRPFIWNKGRMEYCLVQNNTVTGVFSGTTDIQFSPLIELLHQQATTHVTPAIINCVIRNNKTTADFSSSTLTSLAGRQRGFLVYINLHDPAKGKPSVIANNLIYNNECSYIKSSTSPATNGGGFFGTGFQNPSGGTGPSSVYIMNNTFANNKTSNLGGNMMLINTAAAYYSNIINNVYYKNEKHLAGSLVTPTTVEIASQNPTIGNCFNNYATGKTFYNNPSAPKRIAGNVVFETGTADKALFVRPTVLAGALTDGSEQTANWSLQTGSYLVGKAVASNINDTILAAYTAAGIYDFSGRPFESTRAVGAFETGTVGTVTPPVTAISTTVDKGVAIFTFRGGLKTNIDGTLQVFNIMGQLVKSVEVEAGQVVTLPSGTYIVRVSAPNVSLVKKVIL